LHFSQILAAKSQIIGPGRLLKTKLWRSEFFSKRLNTDIFFKGEHLQRGGSIKSRGIYHWLRVHRQSHTSVVGKGCLNTQLGLAWACDTLGMTCKLVTSNPVHRSLLESYGAEVIQTDEPDEVCHESSQTLVFDPAKEDEFIQGQATLAIEVLEDVERFDAMVCPTVSGNLFSGIQCVFEALRPRVNLIACRPTETDKKLPAHCLPEETIMVTKSQMAAACLQLAIHEKQVVEPLGAMGLAALLAQPEPWQGQKLVVLLTSGNDPAVLDRFP